MNAGSRGGRGATKPRAVRGAAILPHHVIHVRHAGAAHDAVDERDSRVMRGRARVRARRRCKRLGRPFYRFLRKGTVADFSHLMRLDTLLGLRFGAWFTPSTRIAIACGVSWRA